MTFFPARLMTLAFLAVALIAGGCANPRKGLETAIGGAATPGSAQDFQVNVGDRVFFTVDSSALSAEAQQTLTRQAQWLNQYSQYNFVIEGHADERGTREYNLALGDRRANAVKNYLVALGIDPARLLTISYGEERPAEPGNDDTAWAKNRRAVSLVSTVN
jgi:peptidoglycan-associated lipoprotein